jgi:release factor glutamine methyltransferase
MNARTDFPRVVAEVEAFWKPLPDKPEETPQGVTRALWLAAAGSPLSVERALAAELPDLDAAGAAKLRGLVARKQAGEPLAHLSERQNFMGLELLAGPGALIPRKETEILAKAALGKLEALAAERGSLLVMDICTGSGNLAVTYAVRTPGARVVASDLSEEAVALARRNQALLGLPPGRLEFRAGDLFAPFDGEEFVGKCDLVSCNPPYISSAKVPEMHKEISSFEPAMAFNGGIYGVSILTKLIRTAPRFLKKGSWLCFECGLGQGALMAKQVQKLPDYAVVETASDAAGEIRAIMARTV